MQAIGSFRLLFGTALVAVLMPVSVLAFAGHASAATPPAIQSNTGSGQQLYDDVKHYESFGIHRYGTPGADQAMDWIAGRLRDAGLTVQTQRFAMDRQYFLDTATLRAGDQTLSVLPQWWIAPAQASFELTAPVAGPSGDATGKFARLSLPYDSGAYLNDKHRAAIADALSRHPAALLLTIEHPSGEIST